MLADLIFRFRALFCRKSVEADLDDELRFHFERQVVKHLDLDSEPTFGVYVTLRQVSMGYLPYLVNGMWWVVRSTTNPDSLAGPVRAAVQAADSEVATSRMAPLESFVAEGAALRRFNAWLAEPVARQRDSKIDVPAR